MSEARVLNRPVVVAERQEPPPPRRPHILASPLYKEPEYQGLELQRIRQSLGLSGWDVADAMGVPIAKIVQAECGHPNAYDVRKREQAWLRQHILDHWPRVGER